MTFDEVERIQMYVMRRSRNEMRYVFTGEGWGGGLREIFVFQAYLHIFSNFKTNSLNFPGVGGGGSS